MNKLWHARLNTAPDHAKGYARSCGVGGPLASAIAAQADSPAGQARRGLFCPREFLARTAQEVNQIPALSVRSADVSHEETGTSALLFNLDLPINVDHTPQKSPYLHETATYVIVINRSL